MELPTAQGTVIQQPYGVQPVVPMGQAVEPIAQPMAPMGTVVQQPSGALPMVAAQPMMVAQAPQYGAGTAVPYGGPTAVPYVPPAQQAPVATAPQPVAMSRGPSQRQFEAILTSHSGQAVVSKGTICCPCGMCIHPLIICPCCITELALGPSDKAVVLEWDDGRNHLFLHDSCKQHLVIDKVVAGNSVGAFCCGWCDPEPDKHLFDFDAHEAVLRVRGTPNLVLGALSDGKLGLVTSDSTSRFQFY